MAGSDKLMETEGKLPGLREFLRRLVFLVRPYGAGKAAIVWGVMLAQALLQMAGVGSVFPFLALASNPESFRQSHIGSRILSLLPPMDNAGLLLLAGCVSVLTLVASSALNMLSDYVRARYAQGLGHWLRVQLLSRLVAQPWSYFLQRNSGELLKKAAGDVRFMVDSVLMPLLEAASRFLTAAFLVALIVFLDWRVALGAAVGLSLYYAAVFRVIQSKRRAWSEQYKIADRGVMREAHQLLGGIKTIKIRHAEEHFVARFAGHSRMVANILSQAPLAMHLPRHLLEPLAFGSVIVAVLVYSRGGGDLSSVFPLVGVIGLAGYRLLPAVQLCYTQIVQAVLCRHGVDEVYEEMKRVPPDRTVAPRGSVIPMKWNDRIEFEDVSFSYSDASEPVLKNLNFSIPKHASLAVVGATGAGKSTLVDILMGLHAPTRGSIRVDGEKLDGRSMRSWQAGIGYVPQDIFLIDDTIARNIALGEIDGQIDMARLFAAAEAARILDFIETQLPQRFDTIVGERGVRLSGGQRQRIALARALYTQPDLLILDEATSALDSQTEAEVAEAINNLRGSVTMVVVAHRPSTIERCDLLLELKEGTGSVQPRPQPARAAKPETRSSFKVFVAGHPRGATGFVAKLLSCGGNVVGHEVLTRNGIASWFHFLQDPTLFDFARTNPVWSPKFCRMNLAEFSPIHIYRNPFESLESINTENQTDPSHFAYPSFLLRDKLLGLSQHRNPVDRAIASYIGWHRLLDETFPQALVVRVEHDLDLLFDAVGGIDGHDKTSFRARAESLRGTNARKHASFSQRDWSQASEVLRAQLEELAERLGYAKPAR